MNKVILVGRITRELELKQTNSGMAVIKFNLAVDKGLSKQKREEAESQNKPTADFPSITVFGKQAENISRFLGKGSQCLVEGRIQTGSYQDDEGRRIYTTDVIADKVEFLDNKNQANSELRETETNQRYNYNSNNSRNDISENKDDFFGDDFDVIDNGAIPF